MKLTLCGHLAVSCVFLSGCWSSSDEQVVVYTALDSEFSEPVFETYEKKEGVKVLANFDTESTKTVGLTEKIMAERDNPRCDVFWNNEILNTLRLEKLGLLAEYKSPAAVDFPEQYRSPTGTWHGFAARARILIVNTELVPEGERPAGIRDLADPKWRGQGGIAKPLFGTTATHAACLFASLGEEKAKEIFLQMKANEVQVLSGNKEVARSVSAGRIKFGVTDTDDAIVEIESGLPVVIVYPDQGESDLGTLFIPNTLCILRGSPNEAEARKLVDYLLSPAVEAQLATGPSAQIPLNPKAQQKVRVETPATVKSMQVDFAAAADIWDTTADFLKVEFTGAD